MLVKLALTVNPFKLAGKAIRAVTSDGALLEAGQSLSSLAPHVSGLTALEGGFGANLHQLSGIATGKSNKIGRAAQIGALSDAMIAAKQGIDGKVFANRRIVPLWLYTNAPVKAVAMHEANVAAQGIPKVIGKRLFDGNKMKVEAIEKTISGVDKLDKGIGMVQVATPAYMGVSKYNSERKQGATQKEALNAGLRDAAIGGLVTTSLMIPRKLITRPLAKAHVELSKDNRYGYKLLETASKHAEAAMNRGTHKLMYSTPEANLKAPVGRVLGGGLKKLFGQDSVVEYRPGHGYLTKMEAHDLDMNKFKNKAKGTVEKINDWLAGEM